MEYHDPQRGRELAERTREFVDDVVIPRERELLGTREVTEAELKELREAARERGLYAPQPRAELVNVVVPVALPPNPSVTCTVIVPVVP